MVLYGYLLMESHVLEIKDISKYKPLLQTTTHLRFICVEK